MTTSMKLGYSIPLTDWDKKRKEIKKSSKVSSSINRINNLIQKQKAGALNIITKLDEEGQLTTLSVQQLRNAIVGRKGGRNTLFTFTQEIISELQQAQRLGNARVYKNALGAFRTYLKGRDIPFEEITYSWLNKYEAYYYSKGFSTNGLSFNLRTLRAIFNRAIKAGIVEKKYYPFNSYTIKNEKTAKRAIDREDLRKILSLNLEPKHSCFHARNFFLASYMMYGMSYVDMAFLQLKNVVGERIQYRRKKTSKLYDIKMSDSLKEILRFYMEGKKEDDFIFPILERESLYDRYKDLDKMRKSYNLALKRLALLCGIEEKLTSYVARHSFATQALLNDVPIKAISEMLGHSSLSTTEVYLKSLPTNVLDEYSDRVSL